MFDEFWIVYPKKTEKPLAKKRFEQLSESIQRTIINDVIDRTQNHAQWSDRQMIPNPSRYLLREMWKDDIIQAKTKEMEQAELEDSVNPVHSRLWTMLKQMYGERFERSFGATMPKAWIYGLNDLGQNEATRILRYLANDKERYLLPDLPKVKQIRAIGKDLNKPKTLLLPVKKSDSTTAKEAFNNIFSNVLRRERFKRSISI